MSLNFFNAGFLTTDGIYGFKGEIGFFAYSFFISGNYTSGRGGAALIAFKSLKLDLAGSGATIFG